MDKVIKEGALRVLISESTCDVILSCKGHRLMAHKLILSIASPVFRELLRKNSTDSTTVIILPDINSSTMSTMLDYIYTGTTVVYSHSLREFLSVANFLQIAIDPQSIEGVLETLQKVENVKKLDEECSEKMYNGPTLLEKQNSDYCNTDVKKQEIVCMENRIVEPVSNLPNALTAEPKYLHTKPQKRLPDLLPITSATFRKNKQRTLCNVVVPSPWSQRSDKSFLGDPRAGPLTSPEKEIFQPHMEDTNNNFQLSSTIETPKSSPKSLDSIIRHLYLNNGGKDRNTNKCTKINTAIGEDYSKKKHITPQCSDSYQKDISKTLEGSEPVSFSFPQHIASLKQVKIKNRPKSTEPKLNISDKSEISISKCINFKTQRTCSNEFTSDPSRKIILSSDGAQNLSLSKKISSLPQSSPTNLPPKNVTTRVSPTILNIPSIPPIKVQENANEFKKSVESVVDIESQSNCNDINSFNDNSNDNSMSNDSSNDEKKEEVSIKKKAYKCEDCGKCFSQLRNYKYHRSVHEGTKEFSAKCQECGKMFNDRGYLSSHMKIHRDRKEYACPNCPKRFNQRVAYNMHLRIHTGVKPHECPTCGKSFSRKMLLKQHQRVHTGERPYTCPECGKTFADRSNMSLHARLHTGVKPYACNLCPKSFTKKHHLKTHMNFHTGLKPYTCENCGLAFSQSSNMRTHYKKCILKDGVGKSPKTESSAENNSS